MIYYRYSKGKQTINKEDKIMREIMVRAWEIVRKMVNGTLKEKLSCALKQAWAEAKAANKNKVIAHFENYNEKRFSQPWVAVVRDGKYDFSEEIGLWTGDHRYGCEGELMVWAKMLSTKTVYAYGQKDYRGKKTVIRFAIWTGKEFIECDKFGKVA